MKSFFEVILIFFFGVFTLMACVQGTQNNQANMSLTETKESVLKPSSSFSDTLVVNTRCAVFYEPDSLQLEKIKAAISDQLFKGSMHEYFYQIRNAHSFLKQHWPQVKIIEARKVRYIQFLRSDKKPVVIDIDQYDPYGMFVFDKRKAPQLIDMTNIETQVPDYFSKQTR